MNDIPSAYYPRRARWYSPLVYAGSRLRRLLWLGRIQLPSGISGNRLLLSLLVPGYAFAAFGRRTLATTIYFSYLLALAVFVVWLGYFLSSVALAAMISLHVSSVIYLADRQSWIQGLPWRVLFSLLAFWLVYMGIYHPLQGQFEKRLAKPLKVGNHVFMVSTAQSAASIKRGDWVAYRIQQATGDRVYVAGGIGFGQVQAVAGDQVVFEPRSWQVNNEVFTRRLYMPVRETWTVPEKHWFIWPESGIGISGDPQQHESAKRLMREVAMVSEAQYVGKPLRRWFWRRQTLP